MRRVARSPYVASVHPVVSASPALRMSALLCHHCGTSRSEGGVHLGPGPAQ